MDLYLRTRLLFMEGETNIDLCTFLYLFQRGESGPAKFSLAEEREREREKTNHRGVVIELEEIETSREESTMLQTYCCQLRFAVSRILSSSFPFVSISIRFLRFAISFSCLSRLNWHNVGQESPISQRFSKTTRPSNL